VPVGLQSIVVVSVFSSSGIGIANQPVVVSVGGANQQSLSGTTAPDGVARLAYVGSVTGTSEVSAQSGSASSQTVPQEWVEAFGFSSPTSEELVTGVVPIKVGVAAGANLGSLEFYADGVFVSSFGSPFVTTWNSSAVTNGLHTLELRALLNGVALRSTVTVVVENSVTPLSLLADAYANGTITADYYAIAAANYLVNRTLPQSFASQLPPGFTDDVNVSAELFDVFGIPMSPAVRAQLVAAFDEQETPVAPSPAKAARSIQAQAAAVPGLTCTPQTGPNGSWDACTYQFDNTDTVVVAGTTKPIPGVIIKYDVGAGSVDTVNLVAGVFADINNNKIPDEVERLIFNSLDALRTGVRLGYLLDAEVQTHIRMQLLKDTHSKIKAELARLVPGVLIQITTKNINAPAWVSPTKYHTVFFPVGDRPTVMRHEVGHIFQWYYMSFSEDYLGKSSWWMESHAEWLNHKTVEFQCPGYTGTAFPAVGHISDLEPTSCEQKPGTGYANVTDYADSIGNYLQQDPGFRKLNVDSKARQGYEHFLLLEFMEEAVVTPTRTGEEGIRRVLELLKSVNNRDAENAMKEVLADDNQLFEDFINDFWVAAYRLDTSDNIGPHFVDPHTKLWRNLLLTGGSCQPTAAVVGTPGKPAFIGCGGNSFSPLARAARGSVTLNGVGLVTNDVSLKIEKGGASLYDITTAQPLPATVRVKLNRADGYQFRTRVLRWSGPAKYPVLGANCGSAAPVNAADGVTTVIIRLTADCPTASLVVTTMSPYVTGGIPLIRDGNPFPVVANFERIAHVGPELPTAVTTYTGTGVTGTVDGPIASAQFNSPTAFAFDKNGNMLVADYLASKIRKITPAGVVSTFATLPTNAGYSITVDSYGNVWTGATRYLYKYSPQGVQLARYGRSNGIVPTVGNGTAPNIGIVFVQSLTADNSGNIYFLDGGAGDFSYVRKIVVSTGVTTTLAGRAARGNDDGQGTAATFDAAAGITVDSNGNLFVVQGGSSATSVTNTIRKITPAGLVTTVAGTGPTGGIDGPSGTATFKNLSGIVVDANGTLYVTETAGAHRVRRISIAGDVTTLVGDPAGISGYVDGPGSQARLSGTLQLAIDKYGYLYIGELTGRIRKVTEN
jgi:hypothetical protein